MCASRGLKVPHLWAHRRSVHQIDARKGERHEAEASGLGLVVASFLQSLPTDLHEIGSQHAFRVKLVNFERGIPDGHYAL